jgi:hypothetical protein
VLVKPVRTSEEPLDRRPGRREPSRREVVAQEIEAALDAADEGLLGVLLQSSAARVWFTILTARRSFQRVGASTTMSSMCKRPSCCIVTQLRSWC